MITTTTINSYKAWYMRVNNERKVVNFFFSINNPREEKKWFKCVYVCVCVCVCVYGRIIRMKYKDKETGKIR